LLGLQNFAENEVIHGVNHVPGPVDCSENVGLVCGEEAWLILDEALNAFQISGNPINAAFWVSSLGFDETPSSESKDNFNWGQQG